MAQTIGFVVEAGENGRATVVAEKGQGCGSCTAVSQCHGGRAANTRKTPALNRVGAAVGDRVTPTVASGSILSRMAVLYMVPVFGLLAGAFAGVFVSGGGDGSAGGYSIAFGLGGFVLGLAISVSISRLWAAARPILPVITRIVNSPVVSASRRPSAGCGGAGK